MQLLVVDVEKVLQYRIYSKAGCIFCDAAMELLKEKNYTYEEIKVKENEDAIRLFKERHFTTVPQIFDKNGNHIGGYQDLKLALMQEDEWAENPAEVKTF